MSEKTHICKYPNCQKSYSNKYNLRRHIDSFHGKGKRFRCRVCGKYLSSKQNLQEHKYIHTKVKPFVCKEPLCGQVFRQGSQLSNHKKLHKELLIMNKKQKEFKELKLTDLLDVKFEDEASLDNKQRESVLPEIKFSETFADSDVTTESNIRRRNKDSLARHR